jgi:hypothetical protein
VFLDSNLKEHEQRQKVVELTVNFNASVRPTRLPYSSNLCHMSCVHIALTRACLLPTTTDAAAAPPEVAA